MREPGNSNKLTLCNELYRRNYIQKKGDARSQWVARLLIVVFFSLSMTSGLSYTYAEKSADEWEPKEEKPVYSEPVPEAKTRPKVSLYWYMKSSYREKCEELVRQIEENLRHNINIDFKPAQEILEPKSAIEKQIEKAEELVKNVEKALFNLELEKAKEMIQEAVEIYEKNLHGFIEGPFGFQPLEKALTLQLSTAFQAGDKDLSRKALLKILAIKPKFEIDGKGLPEGLKDMLLNLRLEIDAMGTAPIQIETKPQAAVVYLNGKKIGLTPVTSPEVKLGFHYVTFQRDGYKSTTKSVEVTPPDKPTVTLSMTKLSEELFNHLIKALEGLGGATAGPGVQGAGKVLGVEILILGRITMRGNEATVNLFPYDLRNKRLLTEPVTEKVDVTDLGSKPSEVAKKAFEGVSFDGKPPKEKKVAKKPKKKRKSVWKSMKESWHGFRNWKGFWYTVGGVAGAVVIGTTVGLVLGLSSQEGWDRMPGGTRTIILRQRSGLMVTSF